jgi:hypothetical protein
VASWSYGPKISVNQRFPTVGEFGRPCVLIAPQNSDNPYLGVVDSGSPITVAAPYFLRACGVDPDRDEPVMRVPLHMGGRSSSVAIFRVPVALVAPDDVRSSTWTARIGTRNGWHLPFAALLGQRGWFDTFSTTIDGERTAVAVHTAT